MIEMVFYTDFDIKSINFGIEEFFFTFQLCFVLVFPILLVYYQYHSFYYIINHEICFHLRQLFFFTICDLNIFIPKNYNFC